MTGMEWLFCFVVLWVVASIAILSVQRARESRTPALSPLEQRKKALRAVMEIRHYAHRVVRTIGDGLLGLVGPATRSFGGFPERRPCDTASIVSQKYLYP